MKTSARSALLFPLLLLSILALLTFWINKTVQPLAPKTDGSNRHDPDYIMSNFLTTQIDIHGDLHYKLSALEMRHFPDDDTTYLQRPYYTQFTIGKADTQIQGLRGMVSSKGDKVELFGKVKVTRPAFEDKQESTLETEHLTIFPKEDLVRTESPVIIRQAPKTVIYGTGLIYEKKLGTVTLLHNVRAHYEKPPQVRDKKKLPTVSMSTKTKQPAVKRPTVSNTNNARIRRRYD